MKTVVVTGLGGIITAAAAAGQHAMIGLGALLVAAIGVTCWVISNGTRTQNVVAIIRAARSNTEPESGNEVESTQGG